MLAEYVLPAVSAVITLAALTLVRDLGPSAPGGRRAVAVAVWGVAACSALLIPAVQEAIGRWSGVSNIGEPLARSCLMVAGTGGQAIFRLTSPAPDAARAVRGRVIALLVALGAYWACFAAAPAQPPTGDIYLSHPDVPAITAMLVIMLVYLGWSFADLLTGWFQFASRTRGPVRTGLALMALGAVAGLLWIAVRAGGPAAELAGRHRLGLATAAPGTALAAVTALLTVVGVLWPSTHHRVARVRDWWRAWRTQDRLYPLWRDLLRLRPALALDTPRSAVRERLVVRDVRWRLYRRVIEIRDARLALHSRLRPARRRATAQLAERGESAEVSRVEGYALAEVVATAREVPAVGDARGRTLRADAKDIGVHEQDEPVPLQEPVTSDLLEAADFLAEVSEHYVHALTEEHGLTPAARITRPSGPGETT